MKKIIFFLALLLIGIVLFYWVIKNIGWQEIRKAFTVLTCWQGVGIFGLTLLAALVGTWKWKELLRAEDVRISFTTLIRYYLGSLTITFFFPQIILGGEVFRGYLLREKSSVPGIKGIASALTDRVLETTIFLIVIFIGVFYLFLRIGFHPTKMTIIFGAIFLFFVLITILFYFKGFKRESLVRFITGGKSSQLLTIEKEMFAFLKPQKLVMAKIFGLNILKVSIMLLRSWFLMGFLEKNIGIMPATTILGFSYVAFLIPIPAAIGSHEAAQVFVFNSLGLGAGAAPVFTMVIRAVEFITALIGAVILFRLGISLVKNTLSQGIDNFVNHYDV